MGKLHELWMEDAKCKSAKEVFWDFTASANKRAIGICSTCPVKRECRAYAFYYEVYDETVWGGLTLNERKSVLRLSFDEFMDKQREILDQYAIRGHSEVKTITISKTALDALAAFENFKLAI